jgi:hypothetical protein
MSEGRTAVSTDLLEGFEGDFDLESRKNSTRGVEDSS